MPEVNYTLLRYQADNIPHFDGNPKLLQRFVTSSENLIKAFQNSTNLNDPINICLFDTILSKLTGRAAELIVSRAELNTWTLVKQALINTFADQRSIDCLIQDLINLKPNKNEHPLNFAMRIQDSRSLLSAKLNATNEDNNTKLIKINHYDEFALKTFIRGLSYNMQLVVRLKNPSSLEEAMAFVREEENFMYFNNNNNNNQQNTNPKPQPLPYKNFKSNTPMQKPFYPQNNQFNTFRPNFQQNNPFNAFKPSFSQSNQFTPVRQSFPSMNNPFNQRPNFINTNQSFFRPQGFTQSRPQVNNPNIFDRFSRRTNINKNDQVEPMDTSSGNTVIRNTPNKTFHTYNQEVLQETPESNENSNDFPNFDYYQTSYNNNYNYDQQDLNYPNYIENNEVDYTVNLNHNQIHYEENFIQEDTNFPSTSQTTNTT